MSKTIKTVFIFVILIISIQSSNIFGQQSFLNTANFSQLKVEQLTTQQIQEIKSEMDRNNTSFDVMEKIAIAKGMSSTNYSLLKNRIENEAPNTNVELGSKIVNQPIELDIESQNNPKEFASKIFGSEIFSNPSLSFEPNSNMATPVNYILGKGDELQILIFGIQEFGAITTVSKEGKITIPNIGQLNVNGMTLEAATSMIKNSCGKIFSTLRSGQSNISVTLSKIRTIKVTIIGAQKSGSYSVSSLTTLFNALYIAGGPDENGSYRNIELIRGNKIYKKVDIYKFLVNGDQSDNIGLKDNDIIRIPVYNCRVSIEGQVKKSGIYELIPEENFNDLLIYCSGFNESAYLSNIKLIQNTDKELKIIDLSKSEYETYIPKSGDVFKVGVILNRFENRISIKGAIFRPDDYSFTPGLTISGLIKKADGLTEDAFKSNAQITRLKDDFSKEIISIDLNKVLSGDTTHDIKLKKEDELLIFSLFDFKDALTVSIDGEIRKPGQYPHVENLTLFDVIIQSGGFTNAASKKIEISRPVKKDEILKDQLEIAKIITLEIADMEKDAAKNIKLEPNDVIHIRKMPIYENQRNTTVSGYVEFPGNYTLSNKEERVIDIINRVGGLKSEANPDGIYIKRGDYIIPINYNKISKKPKSIENIRVQPGDQLVVLKYVAAIRIIGSVASNTEIPYVKGKCAKYYIKRAGGFTEKSDKKKINNLYPNRISRATKRYIFINDHAKVLPGTIITIPEKAVKEKLELKEFVAISSMVTGMVTMVAVISNQFK
jgi:protein involved in polysaccharide export with SLBB domain